MFSPKPIDIMVTVLPVLPQTAHNKNKQTTTNKKPIRKGVGVANVWTQKEREAVMNSMDPQKISGVAKQLKKKFEFGPPPNSLFKVVAASSSHPPF